MLHYVTLNHKAFGSWSTPQFEGGELKARALGLRSALESFSLTDLRLGGCWRCKARWKSWHIMAPVFLWFTRNSPLFLCMDKFAYGFLTVDFILSESRCISWKFLQHHIVLPLLLYCLCLTHVPTVMRQCVREGKIDNGFPGADMVFLQLFVSLNPEPKRGILTWGKAWQSLTSGHFGQFLTSSNFGTGCHIQLGSSNGWC